MGCACYLVRARARDLDLDLDLSSSQAGKGGAHESRQEARMVSAHETLFSSQCRRCPLWWERESSSAKPSLNPPHTHHATPTPPLWHRHMHICVRACVRPCVLLCTFALSLPALASPSLPRPLRFLL